jgi:hypothetical protein
MKILLAGIIITAILGTAISAGMVGVIFSFADSLGGGYGHLHCGAGTGGHIHRVHGGCTGDHIYGIQGG